MCSTAKIDLLKRYAGVVTKVLEFFCPDVITFDEENFLYVVDHMNCRVQKFSSRDIFILQFCNSKNLHSPCGITVLESKVYVADYNAGHIVVFGFFGKFIGKKHLKLLMM